MNLKITKAQLKALEIMAKAQEPNATEADKLAVKNLLEGANKEVKTLPMGANGELSVKEKWVADLISGKLNTPNYAAKSINEGSQTAGGSLVPTEVLDTVIEALPLYGFAFKKCTVKNMKSSTLVATANDDSVSLSWINEAGTIAETNVTFTPITLIAKDVAAIQVITNQELADSVVDVVSLVERVISASIAREADRVIFLGQASVYTGLKTLVGVNVVTVAATATDTVMADALIDMQLQMPEYAATGDACYVTSLKGWGKMRKLKGTDNHYLARATSKVADGNKGLNSQYESVGTFDEKEVFVVKGLDDFSAAAKVPVFYGNFNYFLVGIRSEMDAAFFNTGMVGSINLLTSLQSALRVGARLAFGNAQPGIFTRLVLS